MSPAFLDYADSTNSDALHSSMLFRLFAAETTLCSKEHSWPDLMLCVCNAAAGSCKKCHAAGCVNKTRARELKSSARFKTKAARQSMQGGPCNQAQSIPVASGFLVGLTPKHACYSHGDRGARASTVMRIRAKICTVFTRHELTAPHNQGAPHTPARCSREVACSSWLGAWVAHLSTGATSCVCSRQHDTRHHEAVGMTSSRLTS